MVSLIKVDPRGPMGPMMALVCCHEYLNPKAIKELANQQEVSARAFTKFEGDISGKEEFCETNFLSRIQVIQSEFMQNIANVYYQMRKTQISDFYLDKVVEVVAPLQMSVIDTNYPGVLNGDEKEAVQAWIARYSEGMMTDAQIQDVVDNPMTPAAFQQRLQAGTDLTNACGSKQLSEDDFAELVQIIQSFSTPTILTSQSPIVTQLAGEYLAYFGKNNNDVKGLQSLVTLLEIAREKYFPKAAVTA